MPYNPKIHEAQMAARDVNESLLMAMGGDEFGQSYRVSAALKQFGVLSDKIRELVLATSEAALEIKEAA